MSKQFRFSELSKEVQDKLCKDFYEDMVADDADYTMNLARDYLESNDEEYLYTKIGQEI